MLFKIQRKPSLTQRRRKVVRVAAGEIHPMWGGAAAEREWNERDAELQHIELRHWLRLRRRAKFTNQTIEEVAREEGVGAALTDVEVEAAKILEARSMPTRSRLWQATCKDEEGEKLRSVVVRIEHELVHVVATIAASPLGGRCDTIMRPPPILVPLTITPALHTSLGVHAADAGGNWVVVARKAVAVRSTPQYDSERVVDAYAEPGATVSVVSAVLDRHESDTARLPCLMLKLEDGRRWLPSAVPSVGPPRRQKQLLRKAAIIAPPPFEGPAISQSAGPDSTSTVV